MNLALLIGAAAGGGLLLVASGLVPARPPLAEALARLHRPRAATPEREGEGLLVRWLGLPLARTGAGQRLALIAASDLRVTGRRAETLIANQVVCALVGLLWAPTTVAVTAAGGVLVPLLLPVWVSLLLAVAGSAVPLLGLRAAAAERRRAFRHALGCFLDLVAVRLAGGDGIESALGSSASAGRGWAFGELRQALNEARLMGEPPWAGLDRLGSALGVAELNELAAGVTLAGDEGARVRDSITAKARSIRLRGLADAEGFAQAASERMSLPVVLLMVGFVAYLGYPAVMQVLTGL